MDSSDRNAPQFLPRRSFLALGAAAGLAPVMFANAGAGPEKAATAAGERWYETAWRRAVIDMHIPDWDPKFLSEFDPDEYVRMLKLSRAQSIVCYAHSHAGLFNFPTKVGAQHAGLEGRDIVGELIERCHANDIAVVLYASLIHDRWAFDHHSEWRMKAADGSIFGQGGRYGVVCPNSPYREYVRAWTEEICGRYDFEGMRFDMTFWVGVCYCDHCRARFASEAGGEMPKTADWLDAKWVALQRRREAWLAEFAGIATGAVRRIKPGATVEHQASTFPLSWTFGVGPGLAAQNDFLQGDFYGDALQGSFVRKLLEGLTPNRPFAYETSFSTELRDHTGSKPEALLEAKASAAIADAAAFVFIDAIDPIGTLSPRVHERMGRIFDRLETYYEHLGGERVADVAIFYSLESKFSFRGNGRPVMQADTSDSHTAAAMAAAKRLIRKHVPFTVATKAAIGNLSRFKAIILPDVNMMDEEEARAIIEYVRNGGKLYASGGSSLVDKEGRLQKDFMLGKAFGAELVKADWNDFEHYVSPTEKGEPFFADFDAKRPAFARGYAMRIRAREGAEVLATRTMPWPAADPTKFSSIHSNPPWTPTGEPEIVRNRFGKGEAIYSATPVEEIEALAGTFDSLLASLASGFQIEVEAPGSIEATMFYQPDRGRYLISLVNFQQELPNIPVEGIRVTLRPAGRRIRRVRRIQDGKRLGLKRGKDGVSFVAPRVGTLAMFEAELDS